MTFGNKHWHLQLNDNARMIAPRATIGEAMKTLADAFEHTLQDMYYAENAITKALPNVIGAVSNADLKTALQHHLTETKGQIKMLDKVFETIGKDAKGEK